MSKSSSSSKSRSKRKKKRQQKIENFSKSVGLSPVQMLLALLMLVGLGCIVLYVALGGGTKKENAATVLSEDKVLKLELSTDQKLQEIRTVKFPADSNFLAVIEKMNFLELELDKLESEGQLTDAQNLAIERLRLRNKSVIVTMMMNNKVSCDAEKVDLLEYCNARVDSPDSELKEGSRFWLCSLPALEFVNAPDDRTLDSFSRAVEKYSDGYLGNPKSAATLAGLVIKMSKDNPQTMEYAKRAYVKLSDQMFKSKLPEIKAIGTKVKELARFGEFNIPSLEYRILWSDPTAKEDLAGAFDALEKNPDANPITWISIIRSYERYLAIDRIEEAGAAWQKMWAFSEQVENEHVQKAVQSILKRQRTRAMFMGQDFDVTGSSMTNGESIVTNQHDFVAIIYCDKGDKTLSSLVRLGKATRDQQLKYLPILAFEHELNENDIESLHMVPREIRIADHETSRKYFEAFPADFFPYVLLVDRKGTVVSVNVDIDQIDTRIARIQARARAKRGAVNEAVSAGAGSSESP